MEKKLYNMKKGLAYISELTKLNAPNYDPMYKSELKQNPEIFRKYNGVFSHIYDRAHKNGFIVEPFKKSEIKSNPYVYHRYTMKSLKRKQDFNHRKDMDKAIS
jgi:hypothetical protein